jgi:hypothetical protein
MALNFVAISEQRRYAKDLEIGQKNEELKENEEQAMMASVIGKNRIQLFSCKGYRTCRSYNKCGNVSLLIGEVHIDGTSLTCRDCKTVLSKPSLVDLKKAVKRL